MLLMLAFERRTLYSKDDTEKETPENKGYKGEAVGEQLEKLEKEQLGRIFLTETAWVLGRKNSAY